MQTKSAIAALLLVLNISVASACAREPERDTAIGISPSVTQAEPGRMQNRSRHVPGQLMLRFAAQVAPDRAEAILAEHQARILTRYSDPRLFHIALPEGLAADEGLALFQALTEIEFAELNLINKTED